MKIAINTRLLIENKLDGIGWFTFHSLKRIVKKHKEHKFYFIFDRKYSDNFIFSENVEPVVVSPPTRHPVLWKTWLNFSLPSFLQRLKPDFFLSPCGFLPHPLEIPSLTVIHDINFEHNPQDLPLLTRLFYRQEFPKFARRASHIATVSEYSKQDIVKTYNIEHRKVSVVYNGVDDSYVPVNQLIKDEIKKKYTSNNDYFLFVGSVHPRKNLKRLILAFDKFKKETKLRHKLVIVGAMFFKNSELLSVFEQLEFKDEIIFTGRLENEELSRVYAAASALVFVPYFEGFGMPIIEAMKCNVPVISANVTSMPEVAGNAALFVNPYDINEIADAMKKIVVDTNLQQELIEKGRAQCKKFSWDITAQKLWEAMMKALNT